MQSTPNLVVLCQTLWAYVAKFERWGPACLETPIFPMQAPAGYRAEFGDGWIATSIRSHT